MNEFTAVQPSVDSPEAIKLRLESLLREARKDEEIMMRILKNETIKRLKQPRIAHVDLPAGK